MECFPRKNTAQKKFDDAKADPKTTKERHKALERSLVLAGTAIVEVKSSILKKGKNLFSLYKTLLGENS